MSRKLILIAAIALSGCATSKADKAYRAQCLPYTGCPLNLETPEQFEARKKIEARCLPRFGCPLSADETQEEFDKRKLMEEKAIMDDLAEKEKTDKLYRECSFEADKAMASRARPYNTFDVIYNTIMDEASKTSLIASCMRARG